jgi:hypothetical protein
MLTFQALSLLSFFRHDCDINFIFRSHVLQTDLSLKIYSSIWLSQNSLGYNSIVLILIMHKSWQVFVHSPYEYPLLSSQSSVKSFDVVAWSDVEVKIRPAIFTTDAALKAHSPEVRSCRFQDEVKMNFFKVCSLIFL